MFSIRIKRNNKFEVHKSKNPEFILGRAADCDIVIHSDVISRHHLKIALTPEEIFIMDLKSANGTFKNGHRLDANKPYVIKDEDLIRLGNMPDEIQIHDIRPGMEKALKQPSSGMTVEDSPPMQAEKSEVQRDVIPKSAAPAPAVRRSPADLKITAVPPVLSLQAVSKKVETILDNAKKKARAIITQAEQDAEKTMNKAVESAENIIRDAKEQAAKIVINGEESTKVIIQKAKIDADVIIEKANAQAKQTIEKSVMQAELAIAEGRRKGESLVSSELLEIENQKIKLKQIWLEEEKKLWAEFHRKKEEEFNKHKNLMFEERERVRKENDEKRTQFAKELVKRQETLKSEEAQFVNKKLLLQDEIENLQKKEEQQKNDFAQKSLSLKKKYEDETQDLKTKYEQEALDYKQKEEKIKNEFSQKSYALQTQFEEEKSKAELALSHLKKKYDEEMADYKKKEMERINSYLKQEQEVLFENKKMHSYQTRYSLKKAVAGALGNELQKVLDKEQLSQLLDKVSTEIDKTTSELDENQSQEAQAIGVPTVKTMEKRNSKVSAFAALSLCVVVLGLFSFWDAIYNSIKNSESYSKFMFDKMQIESVYVPIQKDEWKYTYFERVLYLKDYVDFKTNQLYIDKWTQHLTNVENARSLKVTEDEMIQFLAREMNLVNQLAALQKTIDARQLDLGLAKLRNAEEEANVDFIRILKSKESLLKVSEWEKQFVSEHMNRMRQQRLPSETK